MLSNSPAFSWLISFLTSSFSEDFSCLKSFMIYSYYSSLVLTVAATLLISFSSSTSCSFIKFLISSLFFSPCTSTAGFDSFSFFASCFGASVFFGSSLAASYYFGYSFLTSSFFGSCYLTSTFLGSSFFTSSFLGSSFLISSFFGSGFGRVWEFKSAPVFSALFSAYLR